MATEIVTYPYEVVGDNALIRHNHEDYRSGDKIELPLEIAERNRWILKPLSEEGKFRDLTGPNDAVLRTMRGHEQLELLEQRKADLTKQLENVDRQIEAANKTIEEEKNRKRPAPASGEGAKPQTETPPPATQKAPATKEG